MMFMNEYEIEANKDRWRNHPVLKDATRFLSDFRDLVNEKSDGWAYWRKPLQASVKLMTLINNPATATPEAYKKALTPIKSFCTRHKFTMPKV